MRTLQVGLVVLAGLQGVRATARAAVGPVAGALVALVCLLPSMPADNPPRPVLALVGPGAGLALAAMVARCDGGQHWHCWRHCCIPGDRVEPARLLV